MKHRTNQQRAERKIRKATELKAKTLESQKKQIHVDFHQKPGYASIIASVQSKTSHWIIRNAHAAREITKKILSPRILWAEGTYNRKEHGKLKASDS